MKDKQYTKKNIPHSHDDNIIPHGYDDTKSQKPQSLGQMMAKSSSGQFSSTPFRGAFLRN